MRVGVFGGGTVGGGVVEILRLRGDVLKAQGADLEIVKICVRDAAKKRDFELPPKCEVVTDPKAILDDASITMVVELMGGVTVAKEVVLTAIARGKHVVTANKALIAGFLPEIQAALKAAPEPRPRFAFEPAVCGGIPIIQALRNDYVGDEITSIMGIMNGTTNYILSKMEAEGAPYADVLKEAQDLGYAETPPDFDVEGWDARSKLAILCKLAFGAFVPEDKITCNGITRISADDFQYAHTMKSTVKILGIATKDAATGAVSAYVSVCIVPLTNQLARISGVTNCVAVASKNLSTCVYSGPGAGRFPTANSAVNDMVAIAKGICGDAFARDVEASEQSPAKKRRVEVPLEQEVKGRFYMRYTIKDGLGIVRILGELAEKNGISIHALLQTPIIDHDKLPMVLLTEATTFTQVKQMCAEVERQPFNLEPALVMPILEQ